MFQYVELRRAICHLKNSNKVRPQSPLFKSLASNEKIIPTLELRSRCYKESEVFGWSRILLSDFDSESPVEPSFTSHS